MLHGESSVLQRRRTMIQGDSRISSTVTPIRVTGNRKRALGTNAIHRGQRRAVEGVESYFRAEPRDNRQFQFFHAGPKGRSNVMVWVDGTRDDAQARHPRCCRWCSLQGAQGYWPGKTHSFLGCKRHGPAARAFPKERSASLLFYARPTRRGESGDHVVHRETWQNFAASALNFDTLFAIF